MPTRRRSRWWPPRPPSEPGWQGSPVPSTAALPRHPAGRRGRPGAAGTGPSWPAAGPRSPPTGPPRTRSGSARGSSPGSIARTRTPAAVCRRPRSASTARAHAAAPAGAAVLVAPAGPKAHPGRRPGISPASHTPSCGAARARPPPASGARPPGPGPPPATAAPQGSCGRASGSGYRTHSVISEHMNKIKVDLLTNCLERPAIGMSRGVSQRAEARNR